MFHSWLKHQNLAKVSEYYGNVYSFVISLLFHVCFYFDNLAVLFRVMNTKILTIFKMLLFNKNYRFHLYKFQKFPMRKSANKMVKKRKKNARLSPYWYYRAYGIIGRMALQDGSQAKAKLYNFKTSRLDISYATDIEICHLCFANCKKWIIKYFQLRSLSRLISLFFTGLHFKIYQYTQDFSYIQLHFLLAI